MTAPSSADRQSQPLSPTQRSASGTAVYDEPHPCRVRAFRSGKVVPSRASAVGAGVADLEEGDQRALEVPVHGAASRAGYT